MRYAIETRLIGSRDNKWRELRTALTPTLLPTPHSPVFTCAARFGYDEAQRLSYELNGAEPGFEFRVKQVEA
ncbi:MAG: hypothetical protein KC492_01820 [Myxococcales bacterium]|nr:hypothetical protein [Myxococcales bacterium]